MYTRVQPFSVPDATKTRCTLSPDITLCARSSGAMTFIVNEDGVVYEKDLGKKTGVVAKGMKEYKPNSS